MSPSVRERLDGVHPKMLRVESDASRTAGEGDPKEIGMAQRVRIGRLVARALELLGQTKQEAAYAMGYRKDPAVVSRWCSGKERPLLDKLYGIHGFRTAWLVAQALDHHEGGDADVQVETVVRIRRSA